MGCIKSVSINDSTTYCTLLQAYNVNAEVIQMVKMR
jgi:hypothetical protein